jgi:hypothetical protein
LRYPSLSLEEEIMEFATEEPASNAKAALGLVAGVIKVLRDVGALEREELVAIFEEALRVMPDKHASDEEARQIVAALLKEMVPE